jgi:hypothetical protein
LTEILGEHQTDMSQYYVTIDGKECGPLDDETIRFNLQTRRITLKTPCRTEGDDWCVVGDYFVEDTYVTETVSTAATDIQPQATSSKIVACNKPTILGKNSQAVFLVLASAVVGVGLGLVAWHILDPLTSDIQDGSSHGHFSFPTEIIFNHFTIPFMFAAIPAYWSKRHGRNWRAPFAFWGVGLVLYNLIFFTSAPLMDNERVLAGYWIGRDGGLMLLAGIGNLLIEWVKRGEKKQPMNKDYKNYK